MNEIEGLVMEFIKDTESDRVVNEHFIKENRFLEKKLQEEGEASTVVIEHMTR